MEAITSAVARDLGTASDSVMRTLGFGPADGRSAKEAPAAPAAPAEVRRPAPRPKPAAAAVPAVADPALLAIETPPIAVETPATDEPVAAEPIVEVAPVADEIPVAVDDAIYTVADLDVAPPVLRSVDLPRWRPSDERAADAVEAIVARDGGVERIRLVSEPRRMIDMMALSAAKMSRFDPALRGAEPIRYRLVLTCASTTHRP